LKIKHQLLFTHSLLVVLVLVVVLINVLGYNGMDKDANIINYSGKLRALSYNMSQISNRISNQESTENTDELQQNLESKIKDFDNILDILINQKKTRITHSQTEARLDLIMGKWQNSFKPLYLKIIVNESAKKLNTEINEGVDGFVIEINEMVTKYSEYSREKVYKALWINGGLVIVIILVAFYSFTSTNKRISKPMNGLMQDLKELSLIDDEVSKKLKGLNSDEISEMTQYFNVMMYDQLTKVFSRRSGLSKLTRMLQYDDRRHFKISLCFTDINGLKEVNDILGHKFGDELIVSAVECIKQEIREDDFVIRMGGDEFLIVFSRITMEKAENIWDRINLRYKQINESENRPYIISLSHGIIEYDNFGKSELELLIKNADDKMYLEKKYLKDDLKLKVIRAEIDQSVV